jgi:hypothetical protein
MTLRGWLFGSVSVTIRLLLFCLLLLSGSAPGCSFAEAFAVIPNQMAKETIGKLASELAFMNTDGSRKQRATSMMEKRHNSCYTKQRPSFDVIRLCSSRGDDQGDGDGVGDDDGWGSPLSPSLESGNTASKNEQQLQQQQQQLQQQQQQQQQ